MLTICSDNLPHTELSYLAFRLACMETLKLIEYSRQLPVEYREPFGFLTEVPFLREVAPQVQIALLAKTWNKLVAEKRYYADLVDEAVVYAVCETAARLVETLPELVAQYLEGGPRDVQRPIDRTLANGLRSVHLDLSNEGDFLLISQLQDLPPDEAVEFKLQYHLHHAYLEPLFDVLALWRVPSDLSQKLDGLLNEQEIQDLLPMLGLNAARL
jgi:hypothetical protein